MATQDVGLKLEALQQGMHVQGARCEGVRGETGLGLPVAAVIDEQGLVVWERPNEAPRGLLPILEAAQDAVCGLVERGGRAGGERLSCWCGGRRGGRREDVRRTAKAQARSAFSGRSSRCSIFTAAGSPPRQALLLAATKHPPELTQKDHRFLGTRFAVGQDLVAQSGSSRSGAHLAGVRGEGGGSLGRGFLR